MGRNHWKCNFRRRKNITMNLFPILYTFRRCPYAMRARMAIFLAGIEVEKIEISLKNKPQSLLNYSPKGTVPVLVTPCGDVIDESRDIMLWALHQNDPNDWLRKNDFLIQQEMKYLVDICDTEFKPLLDRYKYFDRHPEQAQSEYRQRAEFFLKLLDQRLSHHTFLMDENMRFVDVAIFPFIRQFANVDKIWFTDSPYKNLVFWLDRCINTQVFKAVMEMNPS
jgi:glutathione S-transferase